MIPLIETDKNKLLLISFCTE